MEKNHDRLPWPEMRIFIELDSACRNQQGNCDEVKNSARPFFVIFSTLWLNLCNNSDQTLFANAFNACQVPRELLKTLAFGLGFQHLHQDLANVNAWKTMFDPYIHLLYFFLLRHAL